MPLNKSNGNMYPWVTHTWNAIRGWCPHTCSYCYMKRFKVGKLRLVEKELKTNLGNGNVIFVGSSCDMWAEAVPTDWILKVLQHCHKFNNTYVFQTKNPARFLEIRADYGEDIFPENTIFGTTIETNRDTSEISKAPPTLERYIMMAHLPKSFKKMVSIEPIMDFDTLEMVEWMEEIQPAFISIGADSKGHGLPEPTADKVRALWVNLMQCGFEVRVKKNLMRILGGDA